MSVLLELREWLTLGEAVNFINHYLPDARVNLNDLGPLIDEGALPIYVNFETLHAFECFYEVNKSDYWEYKKPKDYPDGIQVSDYGVPLLLDIKRTFKRNFCNKLNAAIQWDDYRAYERGEESPLIVPIFLSPRNESKLCFSATHDDIFEVTAFTQYRIATIIPDLLVAKKGDVKNLIEKIVGSTQNNHEAMPTENEAPGPPAPAGQEKPNSKIRSPEGALVDALGLMAYCLMHNSSKCKIADKPNAKAIQEAIQDMATRLFEYKDNEEHENLSNIARDITAAVNQLTPKPKPKKNG